MPIHTWVPVAHTLIYFNAQYLRDLQCLTCMISCYVIHPKGIYEVHACLCIVRAYFLKLNEHAIQTMIHTYTVKLEVRQGI